MRKASAIGAALTCGVVWTTPAQAQSSFAAATSMNWDGALTGMFMGLLIFSIAYNAALYPVLRERFLGWQAARALCYFALVVGLSPLPMGSWLTPESFARQVYIDILFDLAVVLSGPFLRAYLEPDTIDPNLYRLLGWPPALILLTTPAMLLADCPPAYMALRNLALVAILILYVAAIAQALGRGSRTARYQAAAWSGIAIVYGTSLFHDIVLGRPFPLLLFALFPALALEVMLTALGILDRLLGLRREREDERERADRMQVMANIDALTGLANRRALEAAFTVIRPRAIALFDIDRFKAVNDAYGHEIGDQVLRAAARALQSGDAVAGRLGGEEFLLLFDCEPEEAKRQAAILRDRLRSEISRTVNAVGRPITASVGFAVVERSSSLVDALRLADRHLYDAKRSGRDRMVSSLAHAA